MEIVSEILNSVGDILKIALRDSENRLRDPKNRLRLAAKRSPAPRLPVFFSNTDPYSPLKIFHIVYTYANTKILAIARMASLELCARIACVNLTLTNCYPYMGPPLSL